MHHKPPHAVSDQHAFISWENVLITVWRGKVSIDMLSQFERATDWCTSNISSRELVVFTVIEESSPPPDEGYRARLARLYRRLQDHSCAMIAVAEGSGLRSAIVRGVGISMSILMPRSIPFRIVATVESGITLAEPALRSESAGVVGLARAIQDARDEITALERAKRVDNESVRFESRAR